MLSNMSVPICNRFHNKRANIGKNNVFCGGTPLRRFYLRGNPLRKGTKFRHKKLLLGAAHSEDFMILACTVLIQSQSATDGRTDGRPGHG